MARAGRLWLAGSGRCRVGAGPRRCGRCSCRARLRLRWRSPPKAGRGFTGKPGIVNRGKVAELYHPDWVCRGLAVAFADPIRFAEGFAETMAGTARKDGCPPRRLPLEAAAIRRT